jgi:hypothetical protein
LLTAFGNCGSVGLSGHAASDTKPQKIQIKNAMNYKTPSLRDTALNQCREKLIRCQEELRDVEQNEPDNEFDALVGRRRVQRALLALAEAQTKSI